MRGGWLPGRRAAYDSKVVKPKRGTISITIDWESRSKNTTSSALDVLTHQILAVLNDLNAKATFFSLGKTAADWPGLVREISDEGHEIASHGWSHTSLVTLSKAELRDELARSKGTLEDISGTEVIGYRAPFFSLVRESDWAVPEILDAGFSYSSSVLPAFNPQAGFPGAPRVPFRWSAGLVELPVPLKRIGALELPIIGGAYLRVLPGFLVRSGANQLAPQNACWTYAHPYDFDTAERFRRYPGNSYTESVILFARRKIMADRLVSIASERVGSPLREVAKSLSELDLPIFR